MTSEYRDHRNFIINIFNSSMVIKYYTYCGKKVNKPIQYCTLLSYVSGEFATKVYRLAKKPTDSNLGVAEVASLTHNAHPTEKALGM